MALPDLTELNVSDTYKGVLHTSNVPISRTNLPPVYDGLGNKSSLKLGYDGNGASFSGTLSADGLSVNGYATIVDYLYPVGAVYLDTLNVNPQTRFAGTTWGKISEGKFLAGVGSGTDKNLTIQALAAGDDLALGEYTHTLTVAEIPAHTHDGPANEADSTSGGDEHAAWADTTPGLPPVQTGSTGGGGEHNNIPPYFGVYIWKRLT